MDESSFTISFPEHLPRDKWQYCLDDLAQIGVSIHQNNERVFSVVCSKPKQLAHVGWALFHTHYANLCTIISVTGNAQLKASAYPLPEVSNK